MIDFHCHIATPGSSMPESSGEYYQTLKPITSSGAWMDHVWAETIETVAENFRGASALRGYRQMSPLIYSEMVRRMHQTDARRLIAEMDQNQVDIAVAVAIDPFVPTPEVIEACESSGGRLLAFGSVDPWSPTWEDDLLRTLARRIAGFKFHGNLQMLPFGHPRMHDILKLMARESFTKPVFVHSGDYPIYEPQSGDWGAELNALVEAFPSLKFVCGHCGWNRPMTAYRIARGHENVWLETSWQPPRILRRLCDLLGPSRFVLGSDYPLYSMRRSIHNCKTALTAAEFEMVADETPRRLLGLDRPPKSEGAHA